MIPVSYTHLVQDRRDRKTAMYLKISKLRYTALLEDCLLYTSGTYHVMVDKHNYSVPYQYVGQKVSVLWEDVYKRQQPSHGYL